MKILILLTIIILVFVVINIINLYTVSEGFISETPTILKVNFCPPNSSIVQTSIGNTDCCTGELVNGKCNGTTTCTLSPEHDGIPSCSTYWTSYFIKKGNELCPASQPNYYLNGTNEGCSASPQLEDGTGPKDKSAPQCIIYKNELDNKTKANSCYIKKKLDSIKCPVISGDFGRVGQQVDRNNNFQYFYCQYTGKNGLPPSQCMEDKSYKSYLSQVMPNWITSSSSKEIENNFCSNYPAYLQRKKDMEKELELQKQKATQAEKERKDAQTLADKYKKMFEDAIKKLKFSFGR